MTRVNGEPGPHEPPAADTPEAGAAAGPGPETGGGEPAAPLAPGRSAPAARPAVRPTVRRVGGGAGRRLLVAFVLAPWLVGYGVTGSWAVTLGTRSLAGHQSQVDAGYTHPVSPGALIGVGVLLLVAFAALLATIMLLLLLSPRRGAWIAVLATTLALLAGSVWVAVAGQAGLAVWALFFFGLAFAALVDVLALLRMPRRFDRGTIARP